MAFSPRGCNYEIMSYKRIPLITGEFYHIYNRSIAKEPVFHLPLYLKQAINTTDYYRLPQIKRLSVFKAFTTSDQLNYVTFMERLEPLVKIYAFAFMPNHFHFLVRQNKDEGINKFISKFQNSFAKCFNVINDRNGGLFQDRFKSKIITSINEFTHISRYVHLNPVTSSLITIEELELSPLTSYSWYMNSKLNRFIDDNTILEHFKSVSKYAEFIKNQVDYQKRLRKIKNLILE